MAMCWTTVATGMMLCWEGVQSTMDSRGEIGKAYDFSSGTDIISVANVTGLNFKAQITVSFWVKLDAITQESFILSHGNWEERWKVSVTPDKKLRWTVKTSDGTKDLDSTFPLLLDHYYHFAVVYTGYTMELYADGKLDAFLSHHGFHCCHYQGAYVWKKGCEHD